MTHVHIAHRPVGGDSRRRAFLSAGYVPVVTAVAFALAWALAHDTTAARAAWQLTIVWAAAEATPLFGSFSAFKAFGEGVHHARLAIAVNVAGALLVLAAVVAGGLLGR